MSKAYDKNKAYFISSKAHFWLPINIFMYIAGNGAAANRWVHIQKRTLSNSSVFLFFSKSSRCKCFTLYCSFWTKFENRRSKVLQTNSLHVNGKVETNRILFAQSLCRLTTATPFHISIQSESKLEIEIECLRMVCLLFEFLRSTNAHLSHFFRFSFLLHLFVCLVKFSKLLQLRKRWQTETDEEQNGKQTIIINHH